MVNIYNQTYILDHIFPSKPTTAFISFPEKKSLMKKPLQLLLLVQEIPYSLRIVNSLVISESKLKTQTRR